MRLPVGSLAAWLLGLGPACAVLSAAAVGAARGEPWGSAAWASAGAVLIGTVAGLLLLRLGRPKPAFAWATMVVAGATLRNAAGLVAAFALYFALLPSVGPFFTGFLAGALACLAAEAVVVRPLLLSAGAAGDPESA
jgi:hypothetical protein